MLQKLITMMMTVAMMTVYLLTLLVLSSVWNSFLWPAVRHTEGDYGGDMLQFSFTLYVWSSMFYHIQLDSNTKILPQPRNLQNFQPLLISCQAFKWLTMDRCTI
jgi:hypothetical protein